MKAMKWTAATLLVGFIGVTFILINLDPFGNLDGYWNAARTSPHSNSELLVGLWKSWNSLLYIILRAVGLM